MNSKSRRTRGDDEVPSSAREGNAIAGTERDLAKGKFKCTEAGCKGKVSFGSERILKAHKHIAHGK